MKTLADLKRALTLGTKITLVAAPDMPSHKFLNVPRFVIKVQSKCVALHSDPDATKQGSYLDFPRAHLVEFIGESIRIFAPDLTDKNKRGSLFLEYRLG